MPLRMSPTAATILEKWNILLVYSSSGFRSKVVSVNGKSDKSKIISRAMAVSKYAP